MHKELVLYYIISQRRFEGSISFFKRTLLVHQTLLIHRLFIHQILW